MKLISWNVNGVLSKARNDLLQPIEDLKPDILCLQEIRTKQEPQVLAGYYHIWNHAEENGYSGTAIVTKEKPLRIARGFFWHGEDTEGRIITAEFEKFYLLNVYVPNSQKNLRRKAYRMEWDHNLRQYAAELRDDKHVIICGDFNVAREDIDIYEQNERQLLSEAGYLSDERSNLESLLEEGFTDTFREFYPKERSYTWWSNRRNKRQENRGWRLDYFLVDERLKDCIQKIHHLTEITGSDHCPIELEVTI